MANNLSQLEGTSWHVGYIKMAEDDKRRHKNWCKYYDDGFCNFNIDKCRGSSHCQHYIEVLQEPKEQKERIEEIKLPEKNLYLCGKFIVYYLEDKEIVHYEVGKNINADAPLTKKVYNSDVNRVFELNGARIKLVKKELICKIKK